MERKYFDQYGGGSIPVPGFIACVTDITRGTDPTQRIGNQTTFKDIIFDITVNIHPSATNGYVRCMLVLDMQGFNAPTIPNIIDSLYLSSPYVAVAPVYWDYRKRFKILYDNKMLLTQAAFTAASLHHHMRLNLVSENIGASTTFKNQIYLVILSTEQNILALPGSYWHTRIQFEDE